MELTPYALEAARKAVDCDSDSAEAHAALAGVRCILQYDWHGAETEFKLAERLNPDCMEFLGWYSGYLSVAGRWSEAIECARRLELRSSFAPFVTAHVGKVFYLCGQYEEAISRLEAVLSTVPGMVMAQEFLGMALCAVGRLQAGLHWLTKAVEVANGAPAYLGPLGHYLAASGNLRAAREIAERLDAASLRQYVPATQRAAVWVGLEDYDRAFQLLDEGFAERDFFLTLARIWPPLSPIRDDPRFVVLLEHLGLG
jgi:tetratricopeptide (TPR) repeat protein